MLLYLNMDGIYLSLFSPLYNAWRTTMGVRINSASLAAVCFCQVHTGFPETAVIPRKSSVKPCIQGCAEVSIALFHKKICVYFCWHSSSLGRYTVFSLTLCRHMLFSTHGIHNLFFLYLYCLTVLTVLKSVNYENILNILKFLIVGFGSVRCRRLIAAFLRFIRISFIIFYRVYFLWLVLCLFSWMLEKNLIHSLYVLFQLVFSF